MSWLTTLRSIIDDTIEQEDEEHQLKGDSKQELTPLQSHIGILRQKPQPLFHTLPTELKLHIFSFLAADDLITSVSFVCREWRRLIDDDFSWKERFERDVNYWKAIGSSVHLPLCNNDEVDSEDGEVVSDDRESDENKSSEENGSENEESDEENYTAFLPDNLTWKKWYIMQFLQNNQSNKPKRALLKIQSSKSSKFKFNFISKLKRHQNNNNRNYSKIDNQTIYRIPIFGLGLRNSARGLLYQLMWSKESPLTVNTLYPGIEGIGSGIGFRVNQKHLNIAAFYGDCTELDDWKQFFQVANGLIHVIDAKSTDANFKKAISQFHTIIESTSAPILILLCHNSLSLGSDDIYPAEDPDEEILGTSRTLLEVTHHFGLEKLTGKRHWCLRSVESLFDVCKGLDWLSSLL